MTLPSDRLQIVLLCMSPIGGPPRVVVTIIFDLGNVRANVPDPTSCHWQSLDVIWSVGTMGPGCFITSLLPTVSSFSAESTLITFFRIPFNGSHMALPVLEISGFDMARCPLACSSCAGRAVSSVQGCPLPIDPSGPM